MKRCRYRFRLTALWISNAIGKTERLCQSPVKAGRLDVSRTEIAILFSASRLPRDMVALSSILELEPNFHKTNSQRQVALYVLGSVRSRLHTSEDHLLLCRGPRFRAYSHDTSFLLYTYHCLVITS